MEYILKSLKVIFRQNVFSCSQKPAKAILLHFSCKIVFWTPQSIADMLYIGIMAEIKCFTSNIRNLPLKIREDLLLNLLSFKSGKFRLVYSKSTYFYSLGPGFMFYITSHISKICLTKLKCQVYLLFQRQILVG